MEVTFEVTIKRTYYKTVTITIDDEKCDDPWKSARKTANNLSWNIEDADSSDDAIESIDIAE